MRNWIAVAVAVLALAACGDEELPHYLCDAERTCWGEECGIPPGTEFGKYSVCGDADAWIAKCEAQTNRVRCTCIEAPEPCSKEGVTPWTCINDVCGPKR